MIIAFSGVDGSGKSTQIELLAGRLRAKGLSVKTHWFRPGYSARMQLLRKAIRRFHPNLPPPGPSKERDAIMARGSIQTVWVALASADAFIEYAFSLRVRALRSDVLICDRWVPDSLLDLEMNFSVYSRARSALAKLIFVLGVKPNHHFVLQLPLEEAQARRKTKSDEPFPETPEIAKERYERFVARIHSSTAVSLPASEAPLHVHHQITDVIGL